MKVDPAPGVTLHLGDCLDVMRTLPDGCVDAVVTDPPYGIGFDYSGTKEATRTPEAYWDWFRPRYQEALRCLKGGGFVAVWQTALNFRHFWVWFGDDIRIYAACKNFVQIRKTPINYGFDPVVMFYKPGADPLRPSKPRRSIDFFVANTAAVVSDKTRIEKGHPCPRPLDQVREIIENFTLPGGVVLDPFMGSGTGALACIDTERNFVGIEKDPTYYDLAERRIAADLNKLTLLVG